MLSAIKGPQRRSGRRIMSLRESRACCCLFGVGVLLAVAACGSPAPGGTTGQTGLSGSPVATTVPFSVPGTPVRSPAEVAGVSTERVNVPLPPVNGSGVSGTGTLTANANGGTHIRLIITDPSGVHPAHIHDGTCP